MAKVTDMHFNYAVTLVVCEDGACCRTSYHWLVQLLQYSCSDQQRKLKEVDGDYLPGLASVKWLQKRARRRPVLQQVVVKSEALNLLLGMKISYHG